MKVKVIMTRTVVQEIAIVVDVPDTKDWIASAEREALDKSFFLSKDWKTVAIHQPDIRTTSKRNVETNAN